MEWYLFKVIIFCRFFIFFYCYVIHHDFECTNIFFSLNSYTPLSKIYRHYKVFFCAELSDMCYQLKAMSLVTLLLLTTLYSHFILYKRFFFPFFLIFVWKEINNNLIYIRMLPQKVFHFQLFSKCNTFNTIFSKVYVVETSCAMWYCILSDRYCILSDRYCMLSTYVILHAVLCGTACCPMWYCMLSYVIQHAFLCGTACCPMWYCMLSYEL